MGRSHQATWFSGWEGKFGFKCSDFAIIGNFRIFKFLHSVGKSNDLRNRALK